MADLNPDDIRAITSEHGGIAAFVPAGDEFDLAVLTLDWETEVGEGAVGFKLDDNLEFVVTIADLLDVLTADPEDDVA